MRQTLCGQCDRIRDVTIHASDPFATPEGDKSPLRRLRGRMPSAVTLWTARDGDGRPAGLTVASTLVVDGDPGRLLGVLDEESTLWEAVRASGRFAVAPLRIDDRQLADAFAGLMPAPGGPFTGRQWDETEYGPVLAGVSAWAGCRLDEARPLGWGLLVEATVTHVEIGAGDPGSSLIYFRGRYLGG
jgi:3-hydroxy-9,10-secoandrosta-1,3,5(10)-triene-9,17-dione monooxygenase reductase component